MPDKRPAPADGSKRPERDPIEIDARWQWACCILGATGLGAGGAAVFITQLEAGPVALLVIGSLFFLIGMVGRVPWRISFGDHGGIEFSQRFVEAIGQVVARSDSNDPAIQDALATIEEEVPEASAAARQILGFEEQVTAALAQAATTLNLNYVHGEDFTRHYHYADQWMDNRPVFDGMITTPEGHPRILIRIRASGETASDRWLQSLQMGALIKAMETSHYVAPLLIVSTPLSPQATRNLPINKLNGLWVLQFTPDRPGEVREMVERILPLTKQA